MKRAAPHLSNGSLAPPLPPPADLERLLAEDGQPLLRPQGLTMTRSRSCAMARRRPPMSTWAMRCKPICATSAARRC
ncbi:hypothetical protein PEC18_38310 [Paucibacter sp. O1-1]|nr:hypothetical protein [Paucibacter sp. O1-1]MDA3831476.1 hypothetical protein [Paucibacter sp. O1-1]